MKKISGAVLNQFGRPIPDAVVTVRVAATPPGSGALATIYSDDGITEIAGSAVVTDSLGRFSLFAPDAKYDLTVTGTGLTTYTQADVEIADLTEAFSTDAAWVSNGINPRVTGQDLGSAAARWDAFLATVNINASLDVTGATLTGLVPPTRAINSGTGLTGGGDLSADRTLSVIADTTVQKVDVRKNSGANVGSRRRLNLIEGSNVTLTVADDAANNEVDVTVGSTSAAFDPTTTVEWYDEFLGGLTTTGDVGDQGWRIGGTGSIAAKAGSSGRPGQVDVVSAATANTNTTIFGNADSSFGAMNQGGWTATASISPVESAAVIYRVGITNTPSTNAEPTNGIYFRSTNGGNWFAVTRAASTETATDTTVAFAAAFKQFKMVMNAAGTSVEFFIDGTSRATHTANIPTTNGSPFLHVVTTEAVAKTCTIDYFFLKVTGLSR